LVHAPPPRSASATRPVVAQRTRGFRRVHDTSVRALLLASVKT
jgi:hypothetical protein